MSAEWNTLWGKEIIDELYRLGARFFCIGAGSRSTPLTVAAADHGEAVTQVFVDERSAAFFALGSSKGSDKPAVVITTSGTAMANAMPAVIEAKRSKIPLILISADRPAELQENGANQTIDQVKLFGSQVLDYVGLPCPSSEVSPEFLMGRIGHAFATATGNPSGPVHVNCPFRKPLGPQKPLNAFPSRTSRPWIQRFPLEFGLSNESKLELKAFISQEKTGIIIVGALNSNAERSAAKQIAIQSNWPVFVDISAGFRTENTFPMTLFQSAEGRVKLNGRAVLHLGGNVVSTGAQQIIEEAEQCIQINYQPVGDPPGKGSKVKIQASLSTINSLGWTGNDRFKQHCIALHKKIHDALCHEKKDKLTETGIVFHLSGILNQENCSFWSNSMPVRDANVIGKWPISEHRMETNRGASGIDGIISTASGFQMTQKKPCFVVIGDLAAWHDLNAFLQLTALNQPILVVIVNNGGGGIFSFLPIAEKTDRFESHFAAAHNVEFSPIISGMGIESKSVQTMSDFMLATDDFLDNPRLMVVEAHSNRAENVIVHKHLNEAINAAIKGLTE